VGGMQRAFVVSTLLALIVVAIAFMLPGRLPAPQQQIASADDVDDDLDDGVIDPVPA